MLLTYAGFTKRTESPYDPFGAGHSSTSVSAALGMAVGRDVKGRKNNVVAVGFCFMISVLVRCMVIDEGMAFHMRR